MDDPRIDPADLRNARFPGSSRRYEAKAVDQFLRSVADRIVATNTLVDDLTRQVAEAQAKTSTAPPPERSELSTLDDDELVRLVGEETASVLSTARRAAEDIRSKAEESAARVIREATDEAKRTLDEAQDRVVELTADAEAAHERAVTEAEAAAERIRQDADRDAHRALAEARDEARAIVEAAEATRNEARDEAAQILVEAREEGRAMVAEAKDVRSRMLEDLHRRRDAAREQLERLHAGREKLLDTYALVRTQVEEITGHLRDDDLTPTGDEHLHVDLPELPDGFVGVVGDHGGAPAEDDSPTNEESGDEADEVDEGATPGPTGESGYVDDTVAPVVEPAGDEVDEDEVDEEVGAESADAESADAGETAEAGGADVDALFARIRAEREQSVARAHEVLDEAGDTAADGDSVEDPDTAGDADTADEPDAADGAADVEHVPSELLAPAEALEARADVIDALEAALARRIKRHLADEQNEVLDQLRRTGSTTVDDLLPEPEEHVAGYAELAMGDLGGAATAGAAVVDRAAAPPDVRELAEALGTAIVEPFRRRLERAATEVDGDADELDERLRSLYREWKVQHIGPAVVDALLSAYARGTHAAAPADARVRWSIDPAQGPCPDAEDNALAGPVPKGEAFPTGDECPQAHPGCRCLLVVETT